MDSDRSLARVLALVAVDAAAVRMLWPHGPALCRDLAHPQAWVDRAGADGAVGTLAATGLWVLALWLAAGLAAALVGHLPGAAGAAGRRVAQVALPRFVYRLAAGTAGLGVLLTPIAASAQQPPHGSAAPTVPTPTWPTSSQRVPAPELPSSVLPAPGRDDPARARTVATDVVVHPGDSLWRIASAQLGPGASPSRIAAVWPRWYAANRAEIGPDPDRLTPGQLLHAPSEQETP